MSNNPKDSEIFLTKNDLPGLLKYANQPTPANEALCEILVNYGNAVYSDAPDFYHTKNMKFLTIGEAKYAIAQLIEQIIGEDEKHGNGKKLVNPWVCDDCGTPEEPHTRNQLRAEQRDTAKALGIELSNDPTESES